MPFIGNKPSAVPLTSADIADSIITSAKIVDATIANADIANSTINLTTKVTGTLPVANGGTGLAALGTAAQELRVNSGATALEYYTPTVASSDFVLLSTTDQTSAIASISVDGYFSATYKNYMFVISNIVAASGSANLRIRFNQGGTVVSTGNYFWESNGSGAYTGATYAFAGDSSFSNTYIRADYQGYAQSTTASQAGTLRFTLFDATSTTVSKNVSGEFSYWASNNPAHFGGTFSGGFIGNTTALTGVTFLMSTGNITSANIKLYGLK